MKVLVTGHRGFIGRYVFADWRRELGFEVHGIDKPDDVSNFKGGDYGLVIHLAAWADIRESLEKPEEYYINNVISKGRKSPLAMHNEIDERLQHFENAGEINDQERDALRHYYGIRR